MEGLEPLFPALFLVFFIVLWGAVLGIIARVGGWSRLASRFANDAPFSGKIHRFQSARLGWMGYNGVLNVGLSATGLLLVPIWPFRVFHPPLLIPWEEIHAEPFKSFMTRGQRLTFVSVPKVKLELYGRKFDSLP